MHATHRCRLPGLSSCLHPCSAAWCPHAAAGHKAFIATADPQTSPTTRSTSTEDLIVDVRTLDEYTGSGNAACNNQTANKCNMGHDPDAWMLVNENRSDKAVIYSVNSTWFVDPKMVDAFKACYGAQAATMKIAVSCRSGVRSQIVQDALVAAGFACGNMYNVKPGADGLFKADPNKLVKTAGQKGPWSCAAAPPPSNKEAKKEAAFATRARIPALAVALAFAAV